MDSKGSIFVLIHTHWTEKYTLDSQTKLLIIAWSLVRIQPGPLYQTPVKGVFSFMMGFLTINLRGVFQ